MSRRISKASVRLTVATVILAASAGGAAFGALAASSAPRAPSAASTSLPGFPRAVFLSHVNNPARIPGFPGDPEFSLTTAFTVPRDGFYLQDVHEGEHTGSHYSAPCHFHTRALCANQLTPGDFILPAVIVDVRAKVRADVDYEVTIDDLKTWIATYGPMPRGAAVIAWTGCSAFWGPERGRGVPSYYNCGTGEAGFHQPGFSEEAVRWLIRTGVLGKRGATGTDTFGPDPGTDENFMETFLTLRRHRLTLENLTNLDELPAAGAWLVVGGPRNRAGSGAPSSVFGLISGSGS
jgi:kynurenine formamidase